MLIICPRYSYYKGLSPELRARAKSFMEQIVEKFSFGKSITVCLEDEFACNFFTNYNLISLTQEVDIFTPKVLDYYDGYTEEFLRKYDGTKKYTLFNDNYPILVSKNYKDREGLLRAKRKQYREKMHKALSECLNKQKVIIQFTTGTQQSTWIPEIEHSIGDGWSVITADLSTMTYTCYFGGIFMSPEDMSLVVEQMI